ncbi:MarR family transcriptional regulator [Pseudomonas capsici]|uniref:MarR family winged helix-turn-helix transcriptional regulator n=1 Tax=Pseudomonas capsici TaxID=2810614 RepID=UPI0021F1AFCB|nr:MarR family transcriptional regulator [Pseudomonas capsici]MCV4291112.1 MarR family transcriptional regulator [Pseudomonas capsici]
MNEKTVQPAVLRIPEGLQVPAQVICHATSLRRASRRICQLYDAIMAPCGLRSTQRSILMQIARNQALSMTELAMLLVLDRSALAQNLKPLEREGLVLVEVDPDDRRSRRVRLTQSGVDKLLESQALWEQAQRCYESALGTERAHELRQLLGMVPVADYGDGIIGGV